MRYRVDNQSLMEGRGLGAFTSHDKHGMANLTEIVQRSQRNADRPVGRLGRWLSDDR